MTRLRKFYQKSQVVMDQVAERRPYDVRAARKFLKLENSYAKISVS